MFLIRQQSTHKSIDILLLLLLLTSNFSLIYQATRFTNRPDTFKDVLNDNTNSFHEDRVEEYVNLLNNHPPENILLGRTVYEWQQLRAIWLQRAKTVMRNAGLPFDPRKIEEEWDGKFDDVIPTIKQRRYFDPEYGSSGTIKSRRKRKIIPGEEYRWQLPIIYTFEDELNETLKITIRKSMDHWEKETCLRFVYNQTFFGDYLKFRSPGNVGCASFVGRVGGEQSIFLDTGCQYMTIIAHEIGHSIGFFHEQSRPGRDDFLLINMSAINPLAASNFHIDESIDLGTPYDHGSIMHYGPNAFLQAGKIGPVIRTIDPLMQTTIGSGYELSFYDSRAANRLYCKDKCEGAAHLPCEHSGYLSPNNCSECQCPNLLSGRLCQLVEPSEGNCINNVGDNTLTPSNPSMIIHSSNYPKNYTLGARCHWRIKAKNPNRTDVNPKLIFRFFQEPPFDLVISNKSGSCRHYLEIKFRKNFAETGARFCGEKPYSDIIISDTDTILISFRSYAQHVNYTGLGFKAIITYCEKCTPNVTQNISSLFDPGAFTVIYKDPYETTTTDDTVSSGVTESGNETDSNMTTGITGPGTNTGTTDSPDNPELQCSQWTAWSLCTEPCGGCGKQISLRRCPPIIHKSNWIRTKSCKSDICTTNKTYTCYVPKYYPTYDCLCYRTEPCCIGFSEVSNRCEKLEILKPLPPNTEKFSNVSSREELKIYGNRILGRFIYKNTYYDGKGNLSRILSRPTTVVDGKQRIVIGPPNKRKIFVIDRFDRYEKADEESIELRKNNQLIEKLEKQEEDVDRDESGDALNEINLISAANHKFRKRVGKIPMPPDITDKMLENEGRQDKNDHHEEGFTDSDNDIFDFIKNHVDFNGRIYLN